MNLWPSRFTPHVSRLTPPIHPSARLLVRGVNWLGDAIMATPALLRLREAYPSAHITLLTPAKLADLWQHHPAVTDLINFAPNEGLWRLARRLRAGRFDLGLVLPNSPRSALETWLARIPRRIGYARPWRNIWFTQSVPLPNTTIAMHPRPVADIRQAIHAPASGPPAKIPAGVHHVFHYLQLVAALGASIEPLAPRIEVLNAEVEAARVRLGLVGDPLSAGPLLGLNAGAEYGPAKRWLPERFIAAAIEIQRRVPCHWLVLGGPGDAALGATLTGAIQRALGESRHGGASSPDCAVTNLAGRTTLRELCAVLKSCRALLTNDTGPMHVAAAVGTPVIVPFGSTSPDLTGPGLPGDPRHRLLRACVPCAPCFRRACPIDFRCMTAISVERVVAAVLEVIQTGPGK